MRWRTSIWLGSAWFCLAGFGCDRGATAETSGQQFDATETHSGAAEREKPIALAGSERTQDGLLIGEHRLADDPVIDGDTIRVEGIDDAVRLLSLDTEERLLGGANRLAASKDFEGYRKAKREGAARLGRMGTPMGEEAANFARAFFEDAGLVRLERDDPNETRGKYGRPLAYAFVKKDGRLVNYSVECVRAGMSPYFTKYGYSRRFHDELTRAEAEAREAKRGIWSPSAKGYGDYDERKAWWDARADFIRAFEKNADRRHDFIMLSKSGASVRLEKKVGEPVTVLSTVEDIDHFKRLVRVSLAAENRQLFPIIFFDRRVFRESRIQGFKGEPVTIEGTLERYQKGSYRTLQIVASEAEQIGLPSLP